MCIACASLTANRLPNRRRFLSLAAAGVAAASVLGTGHAFAAGATTSVTADEALARLKAGNEKYVTAPQVCAADLLKHTGLGELFVARNAGNMADTATMGTIEYGVEHLGAPLVVVMGHERCGAVAAACEVVEKHTKFPGSIGPMVDAIVPAAKAVLGKPGDFVDNAVRESAKRTATQIATKSEIVSHFVKDGKAKVLAARYDLDNGRVEFLA